MIRPGISPGRKLYLGRHLDRPSARPRVWMSIFSGKPIADLLRLNKRPLGKPRSINRKNLSIYLPSVKNLSIYLPSVKNLIERRSKLQGIKPPLGDYESSPQRLMILKGFKGSKV